MTKEEANKLAQMSQNGLALALRPAHTMLDGDTLFTMASGKKAIDVNIIGSFAPLVVAQAIMNGINSVDSAGGLPAANSL